MQPSEHIHEKVLASALLSEGVGRSSRALDSFASWLLGAFGAALALIVSNISELTRHLPLSAVKCAGAIFVGAAVLAVLEKYIAAILSAAAKASAVGRALGEEFAVEELDFSVVFAEARRAAFPLLSWFVARSFRKVEHGDLTAAARNLTRWAQIQGLLVFAEALLLLWAALVVFRELVA